MEALAELPNNFPQIVCVLLDDFPNRQRGPLRLPSPLPYPGPTCLRMRSCRMIASIPTGFL
jgi:hypothetical protein